MYDFEVTFPLENENSTNTENEKADDMDTFCFLFVFFFSLVPHIQTIYICHSIKTINLN